MFSFILAISHETLLWILSELQFVINFMFLDFLQLSLTQSNWVSSDFAFYHFYDKEYFGSKFSTFSPTASYHVTSLLPCSSHLQTFSNTRNSKFLPLLCRVIGLSFWLLWSVIIMPWERFFNNKNDLSMYCAFVAGSLPAVKLFSLFFIVIN